MKLEQDVCNGSKRKQIYKCDWLWQTGYYARTKRKGGRGMREGWEYKKLGDCFPYIKNGANIKQIKGADGLPITRIETLSGGVFNRDRMGYAGIYNLDKYSDYVLEDGDLLLSHINSKTYIGRTVEYRAKNDETIIHGMNLLRLKSNSDVINSSFFAYYTLSNDFKTNVAKVRKDAVNQSSIAISDIRKFSIPVPPIQSQRYVVDELDKINELIRLKKEQLKDYDNLAQSIFYEMFGDPVVNEKGWIVKTIGDVCSLKSGDSKANKSPKGTLPYVKVGDMNLPGNENYITCSSTYVDRDYNKRGIFPIGSILFPKRGGAILTNKKRMAAVEICCDLNTMGVIPSEVLNKHYLFQWFKILDLGTICSGSTILQLNNCDIAPLLIQIPPLTLQQTFAKRIELIEQQKAEIQSTIADLETLLASRMQYWFD